MKNLQRIGGVAAIVSAASYLFAIGLYMTLMRPIADPSMGMGEYMAFYAAHRSLVFAWTFAMYIVHGASLVPLVLALRERMAEASPRLADLSAAFGLIWTAFVLLSGFINIWGNEALIAIYGRDPARAELFKDILTQFTLGIDSSDKFLGSLWIGLACLGMLRAKAIPAAISASGAALGLAVLALGLTLPPNDASASLLFGFGAILWWIPLGIRMMAKGKADASLRPALGISTGGV